MDKLQDKIKQVFRIGKGLRKPDEDNKLLARVTDLCFGEILTFLAENLNEKDKIALNKAMTTKRSPYAKSKLILERLNKVKNVGRRLNIRLEYFIRSLLVSSLRKNNVRTLI